MSSVPNITGVSLGSTVNNPITFDPPVSNGQKQAFAAIGAVCLVLALGASVIKILTGRRSGEKTYGQDFSFSIAIILFIGYVAASICMFTFGDQDNMMAYADSTVASSSFYLMTISFLRIAMLCLYQDVLFRETRYWKFSIGLSLAFIIYSVLFILIDSFQCKPADPLTDAYRCINVPAFDVAIGIVDFVVNVIVLVMPVKGIWDGRRHPDISNRVCYPIAFVLGTIACVLSLVHAVSPAADMSTWQILYPTTGLVTLTLIILSIAIALIPTFIRCKAGPIQSPTTTHPHLQSRSASVLSWLPTKRNTNEDDELRGRGNSESMTDLSAKELPGDLEKSTEALTTPAAAAAAFSKEKSPARDLDGQTLDGRTNSLRSFTHARLGSLTGAIKPPSFLAGRASRAQQYPEVDLNTGITVTSEVEMSYEERQRQLSRRQSRSSSPHRNPGIAPAMPRRPS